MQYLTEKKQTMKQVRRDRIPGSLWDRTKKFINNKKINTLFTRKDLLYAVYFDTYHKTSSADFYRGFLTSANFIEWVKPGLYRKLEHIPEDLTITKLRKYLTQDRWKQWFIPREESLGTKKIEI